MKTGVVDVGGGLRGVYTAGVFDYCLDHLLYGVSLLDAPRWAAYKIAYCGNRYARLAHNGWVHKAISNERLAAFGLVSMSNYYAERCVICEVD